MSKITIKALLILVLSIGLVSISFAQRQTGSVSGKVTDNEGTPLPGASVTLSGPALMGTLTYTTTESGDFRFPAVPPGSSYVLTVELQGFSIVLREELIVNVGKTIKVDIVLTPTTLKEEVTVTAPAPTVDVTSSKESVTYTSDLINHIPLARSYYSLITAAPGVVGTGDQPTVHGASGIQSQVSVDGANVTDRSEGRQVIDFSFDIIEEVELDLGAHQADVGMVEGAYVNVVTKSGGNEFHGSALAYYSNKDMARNLIPESEIIAIGLKSPTGPTSLYDFSLTLGGPIIKDRFWFFANGRLSGTKYRNETILDGAYDIDWPDKWAFTKLTFLARKNLKLTGMLSYKQYNRHLARVSYYNSKYSTAYEHNVKNPIVLGMANWILDQNTFLDLRFQFANFIRPRRLHPDSDPYELTKSDRYTGITSGPARWNDDFDRFQYSVVVSFNRFLDNFLGGNHEIKVGIEWETSYCDNPEWDLRPIGRITTYKDLPWGYNDVQPYMGYFRVNMIGEKRGDWAILSTVNRWAGYLQDSLTLKERLTLNLGLRYDNIRGKNPGMTIRPVGMKSPVLTMLAPNVFREYPIPDFNDLVVWKSFEPRVGVVYDLFGDHTTSLKASWSRYSTFLVLELFITMSPSSPFGDNYLEAYWFDLNKNGIIETTDDYKVVHYPPDPATFNPDNVVDPNLKTPYSDEFIVGIERELFKDFKLGVSYINKQAFRAIEDVEKYRGYTADSGWWVPYTTTEPGPDGKFGNADDKQITVYGVKKGAPPSRLFIQNLENVKRKYQGLEFILSKRMSHGWQLLGSVNLSKLEGTRNADYGSSLGHGTAYNTPNYATNRYGRLGLDRPIVIRLQGSVVLPFGFIVSGYYLHSSAAPWARTLQIQLPNNPTLFEYPGTFTETINAETPGTRRYKATDNLDLRVEKDVKAGNFGSFGVFVDILNIFGDSGYTITQDPGGMVYNNGTFLRYTTYGRFTAVYGQRTYKVSARFTF